MKTPARPAYLYMCGFCGPGATGDPRICRDANHRCRGWYGGTQCTCAARHHRPPSTEIARLVDVALPGYTPGGGT